MIAGFALGFEKEAWRQETLKLAINFSISSIERRKPILRKRRYGTYTAAD